MPAFSSLMSSNPIVVMIANICSILGGLFLLAAILRWTFRFGREVVAHNLRQALRRSMEVRKRRAELCAKDAILNQCELARRWWYVALAFSMVAINEIGDVKAQKAPPNYGAAVTKAVALNGRAGWNGWLLATEAAFFLYLGATLLAVVLHIAFTIQARLKLLNENWSWMD